MSDLEYVGKMNPNPFISLRKEEEMRIEEIKKRMTKEKSPKVLDQELTYERDVPEKN